MPNNTPETHHDPSLEQYITLCERVFLRMLADNSFPWSGGKASAEQNGTVESVR